MQTRALDIRDPQTLLRLGYGLVPIVAGADKFTDLLADWEQYLSPLVKRALPVKPRTFMKLVGIIEIAAGAIVLSGRTRFGGRLVSAWLAGITANLLTTGEYFDIAARDALLAIGALALSQLEERKALAPGFALPADVREEIEIPQQPPVLQPELH